MCGRKMVHINLFERWAPACFHQNWRSKKMHLCARQPASKSAIIIMCFLSPHLCKSGKSSGDVWIFVIAVCVKFSFKITVSLCRNSKQEKSIKDCSEIGTLRFSKPFTHTNQLSKLEFYLKTLHSNGVKISSAGRAKNTEIMYLDDFLLLRNISALKQSARSKIVVE